MVEITVITAIIMHFMYDNSVILALTVSVVVVSSLAVCAILFMYVDPETAFTANVTNIICKIYINTLIAVVSLAKVIVDAVIASYDICDIGDALLIIASG